MTQATPSAAETMMAADRASAALGMVAVHSAPGEAVVRMPVRDDMLLRHRTRDLTRLLPGTARPGMPRRAHRARRAARRHGAAGGAAGTLPVSEGKLRRVNDLR